MNRTFAFHALSPDGRLVQKVVEAEDARAARALIDGQSGGCSLKLSELESNALARILAVLRRPAGRDVAVAERQLAALLDAGVPVLQALTTVAGETRSRVLRETLEHVGEDVAAGSSIADSCGRFPGVFDDVAVGLLGAAETDGRIGEAWTQIADDLEAGIRDRAELVAAVSYPLACLAVAVALTVYLGSTFVPRIVELYEGFDLDVPTSVSAFAQTSMFLANHGLALLAGLAAIVLAAVASRRHEAVRLWQDGWLLRLPLVGSVARAAATARFAGTFGRLHERGIPVLRALEVTASVVGNRAIESALGGVADEVRSGHSLAAALERTRRFSPVAVSMAGIGEASGALGALMIRAEKTCREEWRLGTQRLLGTLRPALLVVVALAVIFLLSSLYAPILQIIPRLGS